MPASMGAIYGAAAANMVLYEQQVKLLKNKKLMLKKILEKGGKKMELPQMIKDLVGKKAYITTLSAVFRGKIVELQDDWIKIIKNSGKVLYVKLDMIISITEIA